ncbi:MAG: FHA domain-containing protein [Chloroflexi bacterium]|nr:FHA domain-containing protein [Chloroflexota bacterium]MCI0576224.1 FHA domain-containing protein [Chloroflexota bacterium]MCI0645482.1 FHA domain-containing protein [Chloroflexota bacterium]MCI0730621.1 FHA domain-containing protein [Chloroflexota bacterium]
MRSEVKAKLVIQEGPSPGQEFELAETTVIIGRDPEVDLVIASSAVSRRHARVTRQDGLYYLEDLGSSNGTFLNEQRLTTREVLSSGDLIRLGLGIVLRFEGPASDATAIYVPEMDKEFVPPTMIEEALPTALRPPPRPPAQAEPPELIVRIGGGPPQTFRLERPSLTIGRAESSDIVLDSRIVSRQHARLERVGNGYELVPSPTAGNPVLFADQPLNGPRRLENGDELRIGQLDSDAVVILTYRLPAAADESATAIAAPSGAPRTAVAAPAAPAMAAPPVGSQTMLDRDFVMPAMTTPPHLEIAIAGNPLLTYTLTKDRVTIGRAEDNDIVVNSKIVSRHHARLERVGDGYQLVPFPDAGNPIYHEGRPLNFSRRLQHEDKFRIGGADPGLLVTMTYLSPSEAIAGAPADLVKFGEKSVITIGRDATNDVVLDIPVVSRFHAQIERVGQRYRISDLRSANGTFVNDQRIEGDVWLKSEDAIRIGPYRFVMGQDQLAQFDETGGLRVESVGLNKWVRKNLNILQNISLVFQPREFIVVVGQSGGGKSTLVDAIAGYRPATHGKVYVNNVDVYKNFDVIRNDIGYVPQKDIIHMELTVFQALDYAAQLRMPSDTTRAERHKRIEEVLEDLDLSHRKDVQISGLSGGQQKRVSIGVELLTKPGLFFLDEPTSGLDPGTETALMQLMRRLADQGRTIVLITHATKNVMLADKVVFLARGGHLAWFGPPDEALQYFDQYRSERDRRAREIEFDEIYAILDDPSKGKPADWGERFRSHPAYQKYVTQPLEEDEKAQLQAVAAAAPAPKPRRRRQVSSLRQFLILSARNIKILTRDRFSLALMLAAAPLVALLQVLLAFVLGSNPFDFTSGNFPVVLIILFLPTVYGVLVGGLAQMREIVKEQDIYRRERLVNLKILPYIMSKIWVAGLLALYQTACYVVVHYLAFDMPGGYLEFGLMYISLVLATMGGMMLGLFSSALAPNANSAPLIVILFMVPQIVLGGALVPVPSFVSAPISTRWAFQAFMAISGAGSDVGRDACWLLPSEQREALDLDYKNANCNCMGQNALNPASCNFPSVGQFVTAEVSTPRPEEPANTLPPEPGDPPQEPPRPELPPQPTRPADDTDQVAVAEYLDALEVWDAQVQQIQDAYDNQLAQYRAALDVYQAEVADYQAQVQAYQEALFEYQAELAQWEGEQQAAIQAAVVPAEAMIRGFTRDFGWTFVDKTNPVAYWGTLLTTWVAQLVISFILFVSILILQKRKDVT